MNPFFSLADFQNLENSQPMTKQDLFSDLSEHSFGIIGPNAARICWNSECYQYFILEGTGATQFFNKIFSGIDAEYTNASEVKNDNNSLKMQ